MDEQQQHRFAAALTRLAGDQNLLSMMAKMATEDAPILLSRMDEALAKPDMESFAQTAHALKGLLSTFETDSPVTDLQDAIDAARKSDVDATKKLDSQLRPRLQTLLSEVESLTD